MLGEESQAMSFLRQEYAELALVFDAASDPDEPWHQRKNVVTSNLQNIRHLESLSPRKEGKSLNDRLNYAGEAIERTRKSLEVSSSARGANRLILTDSEADAEKPEVATSGQGNQPVQSTDSEKKQAGVVSHGVLVVIAGLALALVTYLSLPLSPFSNEMPLSLRVVYSILVGLVASCFVYWFHPDFYYKRMALFGLGMATVGGLSYDIKVLGLEWLGESRFELGSLPSNLLILVGAVFTGFCMWLDHLQRKDAR